MEELIERLQRYSEQCIADCLDPDFAAAIIEAINVLSLCQMLGAKPEPQWIPVEERLPEENKPVVATYWHENKRYSLIMLLDEFAWFRPTHWFYLPEPPKEETNG